MLVALGGQLKFNRSGWRAWVRRLPYVGYHRRIFWRQRNQRILPRPSLHRTIPVAAANLDKTLIQASIFRGMRRQAYRTDIATGSMNHTWLSYSQLVASSCQVESMVRTRGSPYSRGIHNRFHNRSCLFHMDCLCAQQPCNDMIDE